jgi:nucleosome binding factor SPN SPT16 subunit
MIFNFSVGFDKLEKKNSSEGSSTKNYALFIADTILITATEATVLTKFPTEFSDISYEMEGGDEDEAIDLSSGLPLSLAEMEAGPRTRGSRNKRVNDEEAQAAAEKRKLEQKNLAKKRRDEALKQFAASQINAHFDSRRDKTEVINSYLDPGRFPEDSTPSQLYVDVPNESILLPINGQLVPFHIDLVKNISKNEQGDFTILRINFISPDMQSQTLKLPPYADRNGVYIRELSYRATDPRNLNRVFRLVKDLQKRIKQRETEIAEESSLVTQEDLVLHKDKKIVPRLRDLQVRPKLPGKKNNSGTLEAHVNGLRYVASNGIKIDVLYSNIKHAFFQPCEGTVSVIIHFELKHPIKVEKKKTNVNFYSGFS